MSKRYHYIIIYNITAIIYRDLGMQGREYVSKKYTESMRERVSERGREGVSEREGKREKVSLFCMHDITQYLTFAASNVKTRVPKP